MQHLRAGRTLSGCGYRAHAAELNRRKKARPHGPRDLCKTNRASAGKAAGARESAASMSTSSATIRT
ncbi:hypothetical protein SBV1_1090003 [Verrucomicrobia bacterium]|nr:hypothetical protein SBV1_1090003 [Verrucomicrobiota bacterium]